MPLTSFSRVQKAFPSIFAQEVSDHVKQRTNAYRNYRTLQEKSVIDPDKNTSVFPATVTNKEEDILRQYLEDEEISGMCDSDGEVSSNSLGHSHSRLTPEMNMLRTRTLTSMPLGFSESESENSSAATTPRPKSSPSPRLGFPVQLHESPRPQANGFVPQFTVSPRKPRQSPRTTYSLDNVDLWEDNSDVDESSEDATKEFNVNAHGEKFDSINGVTINPSKTFDLSDLRRSRSPVACKRNRLMIKVASDQREANRAKSRSGSRDKKLVMSRARAVRRQKQMLPNPVKAKPSAGNQTTQILPSTVKVKPAVLEDQTIQMLPSTVKVKPAMVEDQTIQMLPSTVKVKPAIVEDQMMKDEGCGSGTKSNDTVNETGTEKLLPQRLPRLAAKFPTKIPVHNKGVFDSSTNKRDSSKLVVKQNNSKASLSKNSYNLRTKSSANDKVKSNPKLPFPIIDEVSMQSETKDEVRGKDKNGVIENVNIGNKVPKPPSHGAPPSRKVKFNSFVTVREDELNTLDYLKHSNDSANLFKKKYLRGDSSSFADVGTVSQESHESDLMIQTIG